ncbi:hypothetical protein N431DRAFT_467070 [Stipitochalara longipes BDJ]|nr:hypothetical protein N431DRAFT_467070 [Stipitochalara longipes BDJ]
MFLTTPLLLFLSVFNLASAQTSSFDITSALSAASALKSKYGTATATATYSFVIPGGNLPQPAPSLIGPIITGVPVSVLVELAQPALRSSIASEFKAGNTPQWYQTLPTAVKSYIESLQSFVANGQYDPSATQPTYSFPVPTSTTTAGNNKIKTTSSKAESPRPTGEIALGMSAAIGVLALAIAL